MSIFTEIRVGEPLPNVQVAELVGAEVRSVDLQAFCGHRNLVIIGVPGAFMPSCTRLHLPDFIGKAAALKAAGIDEVVCIAPNNPWTLHAWAERLDPARQVRFLSDGNLEFATRAGLTLRDDANFVGRTMRRFLMRVANRTVRRLTVEDDVIAVTCTRADDVVVGLD